MRFKKSFNRKILKKKKKSINRVEGSSFVEQKANKKIKNATRIIYNNVEYRSKLEAYCAQTLTENNIWFEYEKKTFTLVDKFVASSPFYQEMNFKDKITKTRSKTFKLCSANVRAITYTPDFVGKGWIIETKGLMTNSAQLKQKLFKKHLTDNNLHYIVFVPRTKGEVLLTVNEIKRLMADEKLYSE